ncbi:MAG: ATP-binding protein [Planctomycetota bacterium]|nr:ATP-binding protein [Planctomycetota bacterium]
MKTLSRLDLMLRLEQRFRANPMVLLLGPRQCGKTTLARQFAAGHDVEYFDLEAPGDASRLAQPMTALEPLRGMVVIDEAQLRPELFPVLRVLADRQPWPARFLLLGSASPDLARGVSESLAGRVALVPMAGFDLSEVGAQDLRALWWRGGFPRSFLAASDADSRQWREDFIQTFLERDLRRFGVQIAPLALRRFWNMAAHYHGQIWNASEIGRSLGEAHTTVKRHLDILCGAFVMRQLPPWFENLGKRQVKSPKVYLRDSGLLHSLLGIPSFASLESHPKLGASWEGFALEEVLRVTGDREAYFWNTQGGAELDLLVFVHGERFGFEFKYADAPAVTKSLQVAHSDLQLRQVFLVHPGTKTYALNDWAEAVGIRHLRARVEQLVSAPQHPLSSRPKTGRPRTTGT